MSNGSANAPTGNGEQRAIKVYEVLSDALTLVESMLILARQGLERNPSADERRDLNAQILDLEEQRARIDNKMTALLAKGTAQNPPPDGFVKSIAELSGKVERQTSQAAAASMALVLGAEVLEKARSINFV
jgi:hypothetical protein